MQNATSSSADLETRKQPKERNGRKDQERTLAGQEEIICYYYKTKGHRRFECPKLAKKEKQPSQRSTATAAVASVQEETGADPADTVAFVSEKKGSKEVSNLLQNDRSRL